MAEWLTLEYRDLGVGTKCLFVDETTEVVFMGSTYTIEMVRVAPGVEHAARIHPQEETRGRIIIDTDQS